MKIVGCNQNHYPDVAPQVPGMNMARSFKEMSPTWPVMPDGLPSLWSPRPDPKQLLAGQLDAGITSLLESAPPGAMLTTWHEANQAGITAWRARSIHAHMHALCKKVAPHIPYGAVTTMGAGSSWVTPGLDFYAVDLYDLHGNTNPKAALDRWHERMPSGPRLVAETNSSVPHRRSMWFQAVHDWLVAHHGLAMLTFWNPTGPLSGPWLPDDTKTIATLNGIVAAATA